MTGILLTTLGRVLVVDDEVQLLDALVEALTAQGYEVSGVPTGEAAIEALQTQEFDLLLTDLMMPGMDGIELLKAGLAINQNLVGIIMTGQGTVPTAVEAMKNGAFDYVLKPFRLDALLPMLARAREMQRLRLENISLRETVAIYNLSQTVAYSLDSKLVLENTADAALQQTDGDEVSIMLLASESEELYIAAVRGKDREHLLGQRKSLQEGIAGWVARHFEPLILNGEVSDPHFAPIQPRPEIRSAISMPMMTAGKPVGVLNVNSLRHPFTPGQVKALNILTSTAAAALQNETLYSTLEAREKRFRALTENAPDGITVVDMKGTVIYVSPAVERILGYSQAEALGQPAIKYVHPEDSSQLLQQVEQLINKRDQALVQYRFRHKDGSWRWLESTVSNLIGESGVEAIVFNYRDITERKYAELQIHQQLEYLTALRKIDQAITSSFNVLSTLEIIFSQVISQLQVDAVDILLLNPDEQILEYIGGQGFHTMAAQNARLLIGESHAGRAISERRLIQIPNLKETPGHPLGAALLAEEGFVSCFAVPLIAKGKVQGVMELFGRTPLQPYPEWLDFLETLAGQAAIAIDNSTLFENLQQSNQELMHAYDATIEGWSRAMDLRDKETEGHTQRVTELTLKLADTMNISESELMQIRRGALLHDMGKLGIPDNILLKPGTLTGEEWEIMKKHPQFAYEMLSSITYLKPALNIPYCHHEKWDGTGYPRGLKSEQIPLEARIFAVVDVWDAVTSDRPYRKAWSKEEAAQYIRDQSGKHFDPKVVDMFLNMLTKM